MGAMIVTEKEEVVDGFKVVTKKPKLSENEYKKAEYLIVNDILKSLSIAKT